MDNLDELFEKYGEKEVTLKILKKNLTRRKKWEAINNGLIHLLHFFIKVKLIIIVQKYQLLGQEDVVVMEKRLLRR